MIAAKTHEVMRRLERQDQEEREQGLPQAQRSRSIRPEVGQFLHLLIRLARAKRVLEIGTSNGYSSLFLAAALADTGGKLVTLERDPRKIEQARQNWAEAGLDNNITLLAGDAHESLKTLSGPFDLVFIDAEKEDYLHHLDLAYPLVRQEGLIIADNVTSHAVELQQYIEHTQSHPGLLSVTVPIGRGEQISLKLEKSPMPEQVKQALTEVRAYGASHGGMGNLLPESGHLLHILARFSAANQALEIGTSNGFSGIWLGWAMQAHSGQLVTVEKASDRVNLARKNFRQAGLADTITVEIGEAERILPKLAGPFGFVFLDASKEDQLDNLKRLLPLLDAQAVIVSDNATSHPADLASYSAFVRSYPNMESMMVPVGKGFEVTLKRSKVSSQYNRERNPKR
ncbi:MAG: methyltransferase domain-containing protein [Chloroflexi bacterium]|nr:methyltransferase domain-containing protein [Chloroflexota bacterium]